MKLNLQDQKPLKRHKIVSALSCLALICSFILFLLVGLSLPIIKPIYLVALRSTLTIGLPTSIATELRFGVWGLCGTSALRANALCIGPQLGYDIPESIVLLSGFPRSIITAIEQGLLVVLVLHPIAAGLVFIAAFTSLFLGSQGFSIFVLVLTIIAAIVSSIVLGVDLGLAITARNEVAEIDQFNLEIVFGNGVWMMVTAVALVWIAVVLLSARVCHCLGVRRQYHHHDHELSNRY